MFHSLPVMRALFTSTLVTWTALVAALNPAAASSTIEDNPAPSCDQHTYNISSQADADQISNCTSVQNINLVNGTGYLHFGGQIRSINGTLRIEANAGFTNVSSDVEYITTLVVRGARDLEELSLLKIIPLDDCEISGAAKLSTLYMPFAGYIQRRLVLKDLPQLDTIHLPTPGRDIASLLFWPDSPQFQATLSNVSEGFLSPCKTTSRRTKWRLC